MSDLIGYFGNLIDSRGFPGTIKSGHFTGFPGGGCGESGADTGPDWRRGDIRIQGVKAVILMRFYAIGYILIKLNLELN